MDVLGLQVVIDEAEGYAFLRQRPADADDADPLPRLIPRRALSFHVSLLLALLRKKLAEFDAQGADTRLMLTREQMTEMIRVFLLATSNEARLTDQLDAHINKAVEFGFLRLAKNSEQAYEVRTSRPSSTGSGLATSTPGSPSTPRCWKGKTKNDRLPLGPPGAVQLGTFGGRVWSLGLDGQNTLLTGDIGSGKSTIVDAVTTLLLPAQRISYNKAAGADTRERSLRSYVLGYYKTERNEVTGATKPVALRDGSDYSVIVGVFTNPGYGATVSLAQVFWLRGDAAGRAGPALRKRPTGRCRLPGTSPTSVATSRPSANGCAPPAASGCTTRSPTTARISAAGWGLNPSRRWSCSTRRCR